MALPLYTGKAILFRGVTMSIRDTVTGVQHVGIPTTDLEGTIAYYERLGFECLGIYPNGEDRCTFLRLNNLTLEVWTMNPRLWKTAPSTTSRWIRRISKRPSPKPRSSA